jgi:hypothetical protein
LQLISQHICLLLAHLVLRCRIGNSRVFSRLSLSAALQSRRRCDRLLLFDICGGLLEHALGGIVLLLLLRCPCRELCAKLLVRLCRCIELCLANLAHALQLCSGSSLLRSLLLLQLCHGGSGSLLRGGLDGISRLSHLLLIPVEDELRHELVSRLTDGRKLPVRGRPVLFRPLEQRADGLPHILYDALCRLLLRRLRGRQIGAQQLETPCVLVSLLLLRWVSHIGVWRICVDRDCVRLR